MGDLVEETRAVTISPEDEEFGFVARDTNLLEKALNASAKSSLAGSEGVAAGGEPEVGASGEDVARSSVDSEQPVQSDASESPRIDDKFLEEVSPKKGILKSHSQQDFVDVYDEPRKIKSYTVSPEVLQQREKKSGRMAAGPDQEDLPQVFQVKYLGRRDARGLWGIKHTRRPVDALVAAAKALKVGTVLPLVKLVVSRDGVAMTPVGQKNVGAGQVYHTIDTISYGVQDLVYTRVFSMIVVKDTGGNAKDVHPFECHAFVCESRHAARRLTYSLATAFQEYSKSVSAGGGAKEKMAHVKKRFAIDLRSPEEIEAELKTPQSDETEA